GMVSLKYGSLPNSTTQINDFISLRHTLGFLVGSFSGAVSFAAGVFFVIFMACVLLRRDWIAAVFFVVLGIAATIPTSSESWFAATLSASLIGFGYFFVARRYGLLALYVFGFCDIANHLSANFSAWYAGHTFLFLAVLLALAIYAFRTALGGQKVFTGKLLEE
ncbi:MAG: hypothetical protein JNM09_07480, partial [Blastocatellia bacterium]|nr:hypothetical protein [Blastocatellia bacterium]